MNELDNKKNGVNEEEEKGVPFWPDHFLKEVLVMMIVLGIVVTLAVIAPAGLEDKADPFNTPLHVKPEWYFLAMYQVLKLVPSPVYALCVLGMMFVILVILLFPFIDRNPERSHKKRRVAIFVGIIGVILMIVFTIWGQYS